ncbi:phage holin family protein [Geobacter benzoatilyticus]|jgi:putative membrane protein|uniref:Phage holin family protein n=1 Tax=Geobacter benzoatilyticus TaxID=2815309 RepID=A0ABX7Q5S1_9BACT|nr:phage holin family protein [Geobacter benzoatilyticus]QSV46714.1 phage holin family protein [Geobacter benzoatilyticus]
MIGLVLKLIINAVALFAVVRLVPGITVAGTGNLFISALVLGFLNAVLRPVISFFALPVTVLTLGLFTLVVNAAVFAIAAWIVPGFGVAGVGSAILGALAFSVISFVLNMVVRPS